MSTWLRQTYGRVRGRLKRVLRKSYALNDLDRRLARLMTRRGGVFVEAGANNGVTYSNTLYFEKHRNWTGLLVEPVPELFQRCVVNRPRCRVEQAALVPLDFPASTIRMRYCDLMSTVMGAMKSPEIEDEHIQVGERIQNVQSYEIDVPAVPLSVLLDRNGLQHVDLLSLDVEGYELNALRGLDFSRHAPEYMLIEARYREEIDEYLEPWYRPEATLSELDVLYRRKGG